MRLTTRFLSAAVILATGFATPVAKAGSFSTLHNFSALVSGTNIDGVVPIAGLTVSGGVLFGATSSGGANGEGVIFKVNVDGTGFTMLYSFTALDPVFHTNSDGAAPHANLVVSSNVLYGTASGYSDSGAPGVPFAGTIFKINTNGTGFATLHTFSPIQSNTNADGGGAQGSLALSGNVLYGTAQGGGTNGNGLVFQLNTDGTGFTPIYTFSPSPSGMNGDGADPYAGVVVSGNTLYGVAIIGGPSGNGTIFSVNTDGTGFTTLYSFTGGSDGQNPAASPTLCGDTLYGTTSGSGGGNGSVFKISTNGTGFTTLYSFPHVNDGSNPFGGVTVSSNVLYGTTAFNGSGGDGTIFQVGTNGTGFAVVYTFTALDEGAGTNTDGANPNAGPILSGTTLYGTAEAGGTGGDGTVFAYNLAGCPMITLSPGALPDPLVGAAYLQTNTASGGTAPYTFAVTSNALPGGLTLTTNGVLSGTPTNPGSVSFTVTATDANGCTGTSNYTLNTAYYILLKTFGGNQDGANPEAGLTRSGNRLYGTTYGGISGVGTVFAINTDGTGFTNLHNFAGGSDGDEPFAGLTLAGDTLYGTTSGGGSGYGTVFAINTDGTGFTNLHHFSGPTSDGSQPLAGLILSGSTLYGTATRGGPGGNGSVFAVSTNGTGFTTLHAFTGTDGSGPIAGLILAGNTLYGTTYNGGGGQGFGTVYKVTTNGTGFTKLHSFVTVAGSGGIQPLGDLVLSGNTLYGTTQNGGPSGNGAVFAINTDGTGFIAVHNFAGSPTDGAHPVTGVTLSGNVLYGTTSQAGQGTWGTVFEVKTDGSDYTTLHSFNGSDGQFPPGDLILSDTTLYGTVAGFTSGNDGGVFSLSTLIPVPVIVTQPASLVVAQGLGATFTVAATGNGPLSYQWLFNGTLLAGQTNASLTMAGVQGTNAGAYTVLVSGTNGTTVTSDGALLFVTGVEAVVPSVSIVSPAAGAQITNNPSVTLTGTAKDTGAGVAEVFWKLNGGPFQSAIGTTTWDAPLTLVPGLNTVAVKCLDLASNVSATVTRAITLIVPDPFTLITNGNGGIISLASRFGTPTNGAVLDVTKSYQVTAVPGNNYLFSNWLASANGGPTNVASTLQKYPFVMQSNLVLIANFVPNQFLSVTGKYNGLFYQPDNIQHSNSGFFNVTVSDKQGKPAKFSGKLQLDGDKLSFNGTFGVDGTGTNNKPIDRSKFQSKTPLTVQLSLSAFDGTISGLVTNEAQGWGSPMSGDLATGTSNYAGSYTMVLPGNVDSTNFPGGDGYGVVTIKTNGNITLAGKLGDGSTFNQTVPVGANGDWPLYVPAYKDANKEYQGSILGWLTVVDGGQAGGFRNLHSFAGSDGSGPVAGLVLSGNTLCGTTLANGPSGFGTVFALNSDGTGFTNLHAFTGDDGGGPAAAVLVSGNTLYGTTQDGGLSGFGTVFALNRDGTGFTNLHSFALSDGAAPVGGLLLAGDTLYGTASAGGDDGGTVFAVKTNGTGFTTLHSFPNSGDGEGRSPQDTLILAGDTLYGTTEDGGISGNGSVFAVKTNGSAFTNVYFFEDDLQPIAGVIISGNTLYGTGAQEIYAINIDGTGFTNLYSFTGGSDGNYAVGGLSLLNNTLYGTTYYGGNSGNGNVFAVNTDGTGFTNLYSFTGNNDGGNPSGSLVLSGNILYGTAGQGGISNNGTVFSLSLGGSSGPISGTLVWNKTPLAGGPLYPAGFSNVIDVLASVYTNSALAGERVINLSDGSNGVVVLSGGALPLAVTNTVTLYALNKFKSPTTNTAGQVNKFTLAVAVKTGKLTGSFKPDGVTKGPVNGVVLQNANEGRGYFLGTTTSGSARLKGN